MADKEAPQDNIDPNVSVPPGVMASAQRAEEAYRVAYEQEVASQSNAGQGSGNEPAPPAAQTLDQPAPEQPQQPELPLSDDWERKYKAMKGRYDHLSNENRNLSGRLGNLEQTLATVVKPAEQAQQTDLTLDQITPQEVNDYGEEFLQIIAKQAKNTLMPTIQQLKQENDQLKSQLNRVGSHVQVDAKSRLEGYLDQNLKQWRELNYNEDFLGWLAQPDPYSGSTRHTLLKQAYERNDAGRVLAFFNGFIADEAVVAPRNPSAANGNGATSPKVPLEKFAAPGRARTTAQVPVEKPVIRRDQIANFYAKVAAGEYNSNEAEKLRLETMIFEAQREGRIT